MTARPSRMMLGTGTATLALALAAGPFLLGTSTASANALGSLTIHEVGTAIEDENNEPKVCEFRVLADNYAASIDSVNYVIKQHAPTGDAEVGAGAIPLAVGIDGDKEGQTAVLTLPNGHYKVKGQWHDGVSGEFGEDNWKTFWVQCAPTDPDPEPTPTPTQPTPTPTEPTPTPTEPTPTPTEPTPTPTEPTPTPTEPEPSPSEPPLTGGGGTVVVPPAEPVENPPLTGGSGTVTTAQELPLTGDRTGLLAAWASLAVAAGIGLVGAGTRKATR